MVYMKILIKLLHLLLSFIFFLIFDLWFHWLGKISSFECFSYMTRYSITCLAILTVPTSPLTLSSSTQSPHHHRPWVPAHNPPITADPESQHICISERCQKQACFFHPLSHLQDEWSEQLITSLACNLEKKYFLLVLCKISGVFLEIRGENYFSVFFFFNFSKESTRWQVIAEVQDFVFLCKSCCTGDVSKSSLPC